MSNSNRNHNIDIKRITRRVPKAPARPLPPSKPCSKPSLHKAHSTKSQYTISPKFKPKKFINRRLNASSSISPHNNHQHTHQKTIIPSLSTAEHHNGNIEATVYDNTNIEDEVRDYHHKGSIVIYEDDDNDTRPIKRYPSSTLEELDEAQEYDLQYDDDDDDDDIEDTQESFSLFPLELREISSISSVSSSTDKNDHFRKQMMKHNMSPIKNQQHLKHMKKRISIKRHIVTQSLFGGSTPTPKDRMKKAHHERMNSIPPEKPLPILPSSHSTEMIATGSKTKPLTPVNAMQKSQSMNSRIKSNRIEFELEVAIAPKVHNMLRQSHSPTTPQFADDPHINNDEIEFEFNPHKQKFVKKDLFKSARNQTMFIQPNRKRKKDNIKDLKINAKNIKKKKQPKDIKTSLTPKVKRSKKKKSSKQYKIVPKKGKKTQSDKRMVSNVKKVRAKTPTAPCSPSLSSSTSSSSSCSESSDSSSSEAELEAHHVKGRESQFVIKNMRYAQSPRFGGRSRRRKNNKRSKQRMTTKKLDIIRAAKDTKNNTNKKRDDENSENNAFGFKKNEITAANKQRDRNNTSNRRKVHTPNPNAARNNSNYAAAMQSMSRNMSKSARVLDHHSKNRTAVKEHRGTLTYADYKRRRKEEEEKKKEVETGSSIEWICGDQIGKGAFGTVYKGYDKKSGKLIAIKEFKYTFKNKTNTLLDFEKETKIMKQLKHVNIVEFFDYKLVETKQLIYLIMEYVPGNSIESIYIKRGSFSEITIQKYVYQIICGLNYAHSRNIIHRDIKGKNILIDNKGIVKIADFGSAILTEKENNAKNNAYSMDFESTPLWTAPEVLTEGKYDSQIDIWSTGCCIVEMATALRPWHEINFKSPFQALYHIGNTEKIPLWPNSLSVQCQAFIAKCLIRDPSKRYNTRQLLKHPFLKRKQ